MRVRHGAVLVTGITEAVRAALPHVSDFYTVHDVIKSMNANGYIFETSNARSAVSGVLRKLAKKGETTEATKGTAGKPSTYTRL